MVVVRDRRGQTGGTAWQSRPPLRHLSLPPRPSALHPRPPSPSSHSIWKSGGDEMRSEHVNPYENLGRREGEDRSWWETGRWEGQDSSVCVRDASREGMGGGWCVSMFSVCGYATPMYSPSIPPAPFPPREGMSWGCRGICRQTMCFHSLSVQCQ